MRDATFGEIYPISALSLSLSANVTAATARRFFLTIGVCPFCAGDLSEPRQHNGRKLRHCFSCHFEFYLEKEEDDA